MQAPIVEDSAIVSKILWARLERAGFQVNVATNALREMAHVPVYGAQLVTLDIVMPGVDA